MISATQVRQQPGSACDECRKKKQRCDRQRPRCGSCEKARTVCRFNEKRHPLRQPKRSTEINFRLAQTQRRPIEQHPQATVSSASIPECQDASSASTSPQGVDDEHGSPSSQNLDLTDRLFSRDSEELQLPNITKIDLMQLYIDRVHPMLPILSAATISKLRKDMDFLDQYERCLWFAVLTIATAFSSQFDDVRDRLYLTTRSRLEEMDLAEDSLDSGRVELAQAWILLVFYEFTKTNYQRGWLSAGRLFRHVQMTALYSVDRGMKPSSVNTEADPVIEEEKRRAFWVAYCVDRIISVCDTAPLTLAEDVIYTRLPCPDSDFHRGVITLQCFLSEAIASGELQRHSKIAECVISTTICGRTLSHKQTSIVEKAYNGPPTDYVARRDWLEGLLDAQLKSLRINSPLDEMTPDPLTSFTTMFTHAAVLYLWHIADLLSDHPQDQISPLAVRGLDSSQEISRLAKDIEPRGLFSAHAFTPIPLFFCAFRLRSYIESERPDLLQAERVQLEEQIQTCLEVLQKLQAVNNLAGRLLQQYNARRVPPLWL